MAAELEHVKDSFHEINIVLRTRRCNQAKLECPVSYSSWINPSEPGNASYFSFPCDLSSSVIHKINLRLKNFIFHL